MTHPGLRVLVCEALGIKPLLVEYWCVSPDGDSVCMSSESKEECQSWLDRLSVESPYKRYTVQPFYRWPELTLDLMAQATKGLTDEEFDKYRIELRHVVSTDAADKGMWPMNFQEADRAYDEASKEQRATAFLRVKGKL